MRADNDLLVELRGRLLQHPQALIEHTQVVVGIRQLRIACDRFFELRPGFLVRIEIEIGLAQQKMHVGSVASRSNKLRESSRGLIGTLQLAIGDAEDK